MNHPSNIPVTIIHKMVIDTNDTGHQTSPFTMINIAAGLLMFQFFIVAISN